MFSVKRNTYVFFLLIYATASFVSADVEYHPPYLRRSSTVELSHYILDYTPNFETNMFAYNCVWICKNDQALNWFRYYLANTWSNITAYATILNNEDYIQIPKQQAIVGYPVHRNKPETSDIILIGSENIILFPNFQLTFPNHYGYLENNSLRGFYSDEYPDEDGHSIKFLTTQFGPFGTRYAFPSFDEPYFRARFTIILNRPKEYTCVISNAKLKSSTLNGNLIRDEFESSKKISPSSLAFTISKMEISPKVNGSIHQIVARPEIIASKKHEYVADLINRVYEEVENFLKISCELEYLYHVALPSNRMQFESLGSYWAINHYKEQVLIISKESSPEIKEKSTIAISKLIAQQWFLSYLMVDSWTLAWVNEGLTNFLAYNITAKLYPEWKTNERLICNTRRAMDEDSRCCCVPIDTKAIKRFEIEAKFSETIVYKGTALITMMERLIPPQVFLAGLTNLIKQKKWSTYTSKDLYENMDSILNLYNYDENLNLPNNLSVIMSSWETQMGYPVLIVTRNYDEDDLEVVGVSQMRFYFHKANRDSVWIVPINYATKANPNFNNTRPTEWLNFAHGKIIIGSIQKFQWLILNNQATFYYRINYDATNWNLIAEQLYNNHQVIHYLNRMQIIDDAFSLAEFGMLRYEIAFKISKYIRNEREYSPLNAMKQAYNSINKKLAGTKPDVIFKVTIKQDVEYIYDQFIYDQNIGNPELAQENHRNYLTVQLLFTWLCDLESLKCNNRMYKSHKVLNEQLSNYFEGHILCTSMKKADENKWNQLFNKYVSFKDKTSQINIFNALGCSEARGLQEKFLNYVKTSENDKLIKALKLTMDQGTSGITVALNFISANFGGLLDGFVSKDIKDILDDIGSRITNNQELDVLNRFSQRHTEYGYLINPCVRRAHENIEWRKKYVPGFENSLTGKTSSATKHYNNAHTIVLILSYYVNLVEF